MDKKEKECGQYIVKVLRLKSISTVFFIVACKNPLYDSLSRSQFALSAHRSGPVNKEEKKKGKKKKKKEKKKKRSKKP